MDNPSDPCCQQPVCTANTTSTGQNIVLVPTYGKGFTGFGVPSTGTGMVPTAVPGSGTVTGSGSKYKEKFKITEAQVEEMEIIL